MAQNYLRVKSGELRVEIWCVRRADTFLYGAMIFYFPVGRGDPTPPCNLPGISHCRVGCNGRHICRPYKLTRKIIIAVKPRAGRAPPLPLVFLNVPAARALLIYYLLSFIY